MVLAKMAGAFDNALLILFLGIAICVAFFAGVRIIVIQVSRLLKKRRMSSTEREAHTLKEFNDGVMAFVFACSQRSAARAAQRENVHIKCFTDSYVEAMYVINPSAKLQQWWHLKMLSAGRPPRMAGSLWRLWGRYGNSSDGIAIYQKDQQSAPYQVPVEKMFPPELAAASA